MPLITAIIPNYNHARFLERRIDSILHQSFQDFELIILDDCSTDNSSAIIEGYRQHPKVVEIVYNETNSGSPFKQWAKGISKATGEWIWIAESDDYCEPEFLSSVTPACSNKEAILAYAEITWVAGNKVIKQAKTLPPTWYNGPDFLRQKMVFEDYLVNAGMVIFKKTAAYKAMPEWMELRQAGDYLFWTEIARQGKVYACGKPMAFFNRHPHTVSSSFLYTALHFEESLFVLDQLRKQGVIGKKQFRFYIQEKLVQLETAKKALDPAAYDEQKNYWQAQAGKRAIRLYDSTIYFAAYQKKAAHFMRIRIIGRMHF